MRRKYSIGTSPLISFPSMTLSYLLFSIAPLAVVLLTSPLLLPLSLSLAPGRYFRTWTLITYQFYQPSLFLRSFAPTNVPHPSFFKKLVGMTLLFTSTLTVLLQRNARLFLFLCCCSLYFSDIERGQIFHFFRPRQTPIPSLVVR